MKTTSTAEVARKLRIALDLHSAGVSLMRARLRRLHRGADEDAIEQHLRTWLRARPGEAGEGAMGSRHGG